MATKTRAIVQPSVGASPVLRDLLVDAPGPGEVLVRLVASGVCHTDHAVAHGALPTAMPCVLGHEGAGIVEALGAAPQREDLRPGDRVLLSFDYCGDCPNCRTGFVARCHRWGAINFGRVKQATTLKAAFSDDNGGRIGSAFFGQSSFAQHAVVSISSCVKVPADTNLRLLSSLGCGGQTGAGTVLNILRPAPGSSILITGLGAVGMSALMAAVHLGVRTIIAVDLVESRRQLALELGATHALDGRAPDILEQVRSLGASGAGVDAVVECSGALACMTWAWGALAYCGRLAQVGTPGRGKTLTLPLDDIMSHGKTMIGVVEGHVNPHEFLPQLIELHRQGRFPLEKISRFYPLEDFAAALAAMQSGEVIKPIIVMET